MDTKQAKAVVLAAEARYKGKVKDARCHLACAYTDYSLNPSSDAYTTLEKAMEEYQDIVKNKTPDDF